jgi:hypothetical protein
MQFRLSTLTLWPCHSDVNGHGDATGFDEKLRNFAVRRRSSLPYRRKMS